MGLSMADDVVRTDAEAPVARDDRQQAEDQSAAPTYRPCAVEFSAEGGVMGYLSQASATVADSKKGQ
jgi:hypothetical protein